MKAWRIASGLTQKELADQLGVSQQAISCWEKGYDKPSHSVATQIMALIFHNDVEKAERNFIEKDTSLRCLIDLDTGHLFAVSHGLQRYYPSFIDDMAPLRDEILVLFRAEIDVNKIISGELTAPAKATEKTLTFTAENILWYARKKRVGAHNLVEVFFIVTDRNDI